MLSKNNFLLFMIICIVIFRKTNSTWLISCKPCVEILNACIYCSTEYECITCVNRIGNTKCTNCFEDIFRIGSGLQCDYTIPYHIKACTISCNVREKLKGACDSKNDNKCICS